MYQITCDGLPLLDMRDDDLILVNPKVNLEVNTVGEGSFTIYKNHPHYGSLKKLKSVFEVTDDLGVIFRGRATGDSVDFDQGMFVDLEGAMAYFNDSVVRAFSFPFDFQEDADYIAAAESGNVIEFFLKWLIDNHNSQVQDFQKMKLGNVTVTDPNNYLSRSTSEYASTWETLKAKLFDSTLGGYLCIRYEEDGNYIDYLSEFTETNSQEIVFGENLIDLTSQTEASETYSAIIPIGTLGLTIEGLEDKDLTDDIVKKGDTIYSKKAVEAYGWIYAPTMETTWDDVTDDANLLKKGVDWLVNGSGLLNALEATAVDLHFTNEQAESIRIYKNVNVRSKPHEVSETFPLARLGIDLLNPQNTKIKVGRTLMALTEKSAMLQEEAKKRYSKLSKTDEQILLEVQAIGETYTKLAVTLDGVTVTDPSGTTKIKGSSIETDTLKVNAANITGTLKADQIDATGLTVEAANIKGTLKAEQVEGINLAVDFANISGTLTVGQLPEEVALTSDFEDDESDLVTGIVTIIEGTVTADYVNALHVSAKYLHGRYIYLNDKDNNTQGRISVTPASSTDDAVELRAYGGLRLQTRERGDDAAGDVFIQAYANVEDNDGEVLGAYIQIRGTRDEDGVLEYCDIVLGQGNVLPNADDVYSLGTDEYSWHDVYVRGHSVYGWLKTLQAQVDDLGG